MIISFQFLKQYIAVNLLQEKKKISKEYGKSIYSNKSSDLEKVTMKFISALGET